MADSVKVAENPASEQPTVQVTQVVVEDKQAQVQATQNTEQDSGVQLKKDLLQVVADTEHEMSLKNMNEWVFMNIF